MSDYNKHNKGNKREELVDRNANFQLLVLLGNSDAEISMTDNVIHEKVWEINKAKPIETTVDKNSQLTQSYDGPVQLM